MLTCSNGFDEIVHSFDLLFDVIFLQVYLTLCCALIGSAAGAYLHLLWNIGGILTSLATIGCSIWLLSIPTHEEVGLWTVLFLSSCSVVFCVVLFCILY
jgi:hypothetical protein